MPATNAAGPSPKRLLLIGAGHAHAQVLRRFVEAPLAGVDIVIVSPSALAPYSGMVPGWLSGAYTFEEICIDEAQTRYLRRERELARLCESIAMRLGR